ncbi:MAG: hypothetical protein GY851_24930 [bacterium]|nr:hypothetical protein [bacterium]
MKRSDTGWDRAAAEHSVRVLAVLVLALAAALPTVAAQQVESPGFQADFDAFIAHVDATYPFFELKGVRPDWDARKTALRKRAGACQTGTEFISVVRDAISCLRDSHMSLRDCRVPMPEWPKQYYPQLGFMPCEEGRVAVMWAGETHGDALTPGTVITHIDGRDARQYLDERAAAAWKEGGSFSSPQRARLFEYRIPLRGEQGKAHILTFLKDDEEWSRRVTCDAEARGWAHTYNLPPDLVRVGRSASYTELASGAGYIYLRRVDESVESCIDQALAAHADAEGWIVDLRGNGGGGYSQTLIQRIQEFPRPVAAIIDAGCISAGETLARDFRQYAEARVFGSKTAGSSSSKGPWTFPSGIASVTCSTRSRWRSDRQPIEFNGIDPDEFVEADPDDVANGRNTAIVRAEEYLLEKGVDTAVP